jgi:hypothetical protein
MESGPATWRPNAPLRKPLDYMRRHNVGSDVITTPDGRLTGLLRRTDTEQLLGEGL